MKNLLPVSALASLFICIYYFDIDASWANNFPWILLKNYHQLFRSSDVGELIGRLSLSFVSGFIIFYLTSYIPKQEARKNANQCISSDTKFIVERFERMLEELTISSGCSICLDYITLDDCRRVFENLEKGSSYRKIKHKYGSEIQISGLEGLVIEFKNIKKNEDNIFRYMAILDADLVCLLTRIFKSNWARKIDEFYYLKKIDNSLFSHDEYFENLYEEFFDLCLAIKNLKEYLEKNAI